MHLGSQSSSYLPSNIIAYRNVEVSTKTISNTDDFERIIEHALSCTLEKRR